MAKTAPYPPCTVTAFWLKYQDPARMLRRVTQPPHIAGPLGFMPLKPDPKIAHLPTLTPLADTRLAKELFPRPSMIILLPL